MKTEITRKRRTYDKVAKRRWGSLPVKLTYDPLESGANMHRFLGDLVMWTLQGRIWHRQAGVCRGIIETCLRVEGFQELEGKINEIGQELAAAKQLHEQMKAGRVGIIAEFINGLPLGLRSQVNEYLGDHVHELEGQTQRQELEVKPE